MSDRKRLRPKTTFTVTPAPPPTSLLCPKCELPLVYRITVLGGVNPPEGGTTSLLVHLQEGP